MHAPVPLLSRTPGTLRTPAPAIGQHNDEIYTRMAREMDDAVYPASDVSLRHYHALLRRISAFHDRYRFFYLDMLEIARQYPRVIRRYRKTIALRFEQYDRMMSNLVANRLLRPEAVPGLYRSLFHSIWVMSTFWLQHQRILGEGHPVIEDGDDIRHVWEIMMPHLTAKGLREFKIICSEDAIDESGRPLLVMYLRKTVR